MLGGAPDISLGQKYLTTADLFDLIYFPLDLHGDLKKLTCPSVYRLRRVSSTYALLMNVDVLFVFIYIAILKQTGARI